MFLFYFSHVTSFYCTLKKMSAVYKIEHNYGLQYKELPCKTCVHLYGDFAFRLWLQFMITAKI